MWQNVPSEEISCKGAQQCGEGNEQREGLQTERESELSVSGGEENGAGQQESRIKKVVFKKKKKTDELCRSGVLHGPLMI